MLKSHPLVLATITLPLLLAACGSTTSAPVAQTGDLISLTLNSGLNRITPQGLPSIGAATSAVTFIKVNVKDASGNPVTFDGSNVYKPSGVQTFITLSSANPTTKLLLPKGTYSFENIGKATDGGAFLAYGQDNGQDLSALDPSVNLTLHTLINVANSTLASKLPVTYVNTTEKLDLRLTVKTPVAALNVPLSDYTVTYGNADAAVLTSSKLGANVQVVGTTGQSSVSVIATVNGYVATGAETAAVQDQQVTYTVPLSRTALGTDTTPPTVTFNAPPSGANTQVTLSGTASDNRAISGVRVFDGSVLIGSTSQADINAGAAAITFSGLTWSFSWTSGQVAPELTVVASDAAGNESRAVPRISGTVVAWGNNGSGELNVPAGLTGVTAIAGGHYHSIALKTDGTLAAWGSNGEGQSNIPAGLTDVTAISSGAQHNLALRQGGTVYAWGLGSSGQTNVPAGLTSVAAVAAGTFHSLALKTDGTVVAWGWNDYGQTNVPAGLTGVTAVSAGVVHSMALKTDGTVVVWGSNYDGQLNVPAGLTGVTAIAAGEAHSLALKSDGTVVAWGLNTDGQATVPAGLTGVIAIAAGVAHSLALKSDGTVVAWGNNAAGQSTVPAGLTNVKAIAANGYHSLAIR